MAIHAQRLVDAVALGFGSEVPPEDAAPREDRRSVWERARDRLAGLLLDEIWTAGCPSDVGIWGPALCRAEAERNLRDAIGRGAMYLEEEPPAQAAPHPWLRRLISG